MALTNGKLVPKTLAGLMLGRRTMQDDDAVGSTPPVAGNKILAENSDALITESSIYIVTET